mmetsp:Transcript_41969/g.126771  ORF Transcript_41969/g.126771 Transcript_41969/m.126771 type:complete len:350 (+) Transcript_41969:277-1326(+)
MSTQKKNAFAVKSATLPQNLNSLLSLSTPPPERGPRKPHGTGRRTQPGIGQHRPSASARLENGQHTPSAARRARPAIVPHAEHKLGGALQQNAPPTRQRLPLPPPGRRRKPLKHWAPLESYYAAAWSSSATPETPSRAPAPAKPMGYWRAWKTRAPARAQAPRRIWAQRFPRGPHHKSGSTTQPDPLGPARNTAPTPPQRPRIPRGSLWPDRVAGAPTQRGLALRAPQTAPNPPRSLVPIPQLTLPRQDKTRPMPRPGPHNWRRGQASAAPRTPEPRRPPPLARNAKAHSRIPGCGLGTRRTCLPNRTGRPWCRRGGSSTAPRSRRAYSTGTRRCPVAPGRPDASPPFR